MISKELLSEVFNQEVRFIKYVANNTYEIHFEKPIRLKYIIINMYELAHKCKEWAMNKGFQIISGLSNEPYYRKQNEKAYAKVLWYEKDDIRREYKDMYFMANTEVEAVIKANEYVLKKINEMQNL